MALVSQYGPKVAAKQPPVGTYPPKKGKRLSKREKQERAEFKKRQAAAKRIAKAKGAMAAYKDRSYMKASHPVVIKGGSAEAD